MALLSSSSLYPIRTTPLACRPFRSPLLSYASLDLCTQATTMVRFTLLLVYLDCSPFQVSRATHTPFLNILYPSLSHCLAPAYTLVLRHSTRSIFGYPTSLRVRLASPSPCLLLSFLITSHTHLLTSACTHTLYVTTSI